MKNINKILAVSLIAMLAVPAAHAKIVAETMLSEQAGHYSGSHTVQSEINAKQDTLVVSGANKNIEGANGITVTNEEGVITITGNSSDVDSDISALEGRMDTAEGNITNLQNNKLTKNAAITGATKTKITYDANGLVTAGADLAASDIPNLATSKVTALTGYAKGSSSDALATGDTLNAALSKLENKADNAATAAANASTTASSTYQIKSTADYQMGKAGGGWTTMSDAQKGALDSGITSSDVTQITTNKNAITTLNGNDQTTGSVAKTVKDAITALDLANTYDAKGSAAAAQTAAASDATTKADAAEAAAKAYADGLASNYAAAGHKHASQDVNAMTGYSKAQTASAIAASDTLNQAIGKLEKKVDDAGAAATTAASDSAAGVAKLYTSTGQNTDGSMTQKAVTDALGTKQATISDLATIRSGAAAGATAVQPAAISDMETQTHAASTYQAKALVTSVGSTSDDTHYPSAKAVYTAVEAAKAAATPGAASGSAAGVAKLYTSTGNNTDGSMTQKAVTDALNTKLTKNTAITGATKTKITYDANGLVTAGADLAASDIPTLTMAKISDAGSLATKSSISNGDVAADAAIAVSKIDGAQTTAKMVTDTDGYQDDINDSTKYPNMPVVNYMISQQNNAMISGLSGKIDSTKAADKNSVMVRNGSGVYVKGLGNAVSVADDGTITVNQATNATNATNDGSGNNIANTYATKTEVTNVSNTVAGLDFADGSATGSGNVVTSVTQSDGQIAVVKNIKAIPEPTITDTTGTLVLTAKAASGGGYEFRWEDLGR